MQRLVRVLSRRVQVPDGVVVHALRTNEDLPPLNASRTIELHTPKVVVNRLDGIRGSWIPRAKVAVPRLEVGLLLGCLLQQAVIGERGASLHFLHPRGGVCTLAGDHVMVGGDPVQADL